MKRFAEPRRERADQSPRCEADGERDGPERDVAAVGHTFNSNAPSSPCREGPQPESNFADPRRSPPTAFGLDSRFSARRTCPRGRRASGRAPDGCKLELAAPPAMSIEPEHDGWVVGSEPRGCHVVVIEFDFEGETARRCGMPERLPARVGFVSLCSEAWVVNHQSDSVSVIDPSFDRSMIPFHNNPDGTLCGRTAKPTASVRCPSHPFQSREL